MCPAESIKKPQTQAVVIHCDGASRGNPGQSGAGATLHGSDGKLLAEVIRYLGTKTNNEAEYTALLLALEEARKLGARKVDVRCDSELLVRQMNGQYRVKHPNLKPLFAKAKSLTGFFDEFSIEHVRREANSEADALANRAIDERP